MTRYYEVTVDDKFKAESDFVHRKRSGTLWQTIIYYLIAICIIVALFSSGVHQTDKGLFAAITIISIMGLLSAYSVIALQKHLDLVTAIEFQNALFASAFREGKLFSLIISKDDQLYYADAKFYKLFPELAKNSSMVLDNIIAQSPNSSDNLQKLTQALMMREACSFDVEVEVENESELVRISLIPLPRPSGYFFVSARLFQVNRNAQSKEVVITPAEAEQMLSDLFNDGNEIAYLLSNDGKIVGYTEGFAELMQREGKNVEIDANITSFISHENYSNEQMAKSAFNQQPIHLKSHHNVGRLSHFYIHNHDNSPKITLGKILLEK
jgi:two-component system, cell cycle sensor histidine kinase and response regulator CckA